MKLNKIYNENHLDTMSRMPDNFVDLVVTSPPYDDLKRYEGFSFDWKACIKELYRVVKDGGCVCWNVFDKRKNGNYSGTSFKQALYFQEVGFNFWQPIFWKKDSFSGNHFGLYGSAVEYIFVLTKGKLKTFNPLMVKNKEAGRVKKIKKNLHRDVEYNTISASNIGKSYEIKPMKVKGNLWELSTGHSKTSKQDFAYMHPASFPEPLARDLILSYSNPGQIVYDPMAGSGTVPYEAKKLERKWIASEISKEYCDNIIKPRLAGLLPWGEK